LGAGEGLGSTIFQAIGNGKGRGSAKHHFSNPLGAERSGGVFNVIYIIYFVAHIKRNMQNVELVAENMKP
jgi:hypothetical protein